MQTLTVRTLPVDDIKPYGQNPRQINDEAIRKVAASIDAYGYQQPIVVDSRNVVIVGHTRLAALKALGVDEVPVIVADLPEYMAREYRLVDNRTNELTTWDTDMLIQELRELTKFPGEWFPDIDLSIRDIDIAPVTEDDIAEAEEKIGSRPESTSLQGRPVELVCDHCGKSFEITLR